MINKQAIAEHPVISELRNRVHNCKEELLCLLDDWHYLQNVRQPRLMFIYETIFGDLEIELQKKSRAQEELERRVELLSIKLRNGERLSEETINFVDKIVTNEFNRHFRNYSNYNDYQKNSTNFSNPIPCSPKNKENYHTVPHLYRTIVKRLHPDVVGETESFKKYWDNVQCAYKTNNLHRLKMFYKALCEDDDKNYPDVESEEMALRQEIREMEVNIASERRRIERMKMQEPFIFEDKLTDRTWIIRRKRKLQEQLFQLDRQIKHSQKLLMTLTGRTFNGNGHNGAKMNHYENVSSC